MADEIENANAAPAQAAQRQSSIQGALMSPDVKQELGLKAIPVSSAAKQSTRRESSQFQLAQQAANACSRE